MSRDAAVAGRAAVRWTRSSNARRRRRPGRLAGPIPDASPGGRRKKKRGGFLEDLFDF